MGKTPASTDGVVEFLRRRDYLLIKELGQGACGKTVLLRDEAIDELFVCKKYFPFAESHRQELYKSFVREIKLLHKLHHENVVRIFNYYLYPENHTGYILMEFIEGQDIDLFTKGSPHHVNELFLQAINGFSYLEASSILHRDIRTTNLMVRSDGLLKIIDLGFGKQIETTSDFEKSISLNWWCELPNEFENAVYDFKTEVYFVGKLFERLIAQNDINHFKYSDTLRKMCVRDPSERISSFAAVYQEVQSNQFFEIGFEQNELQPYRRFADAIHKILTRIESGAKYFTDLAQIKKQLADTYRRFMLESNVPDTSTVLRCFIDGNYYYKNLPVLEVEIVKRFLKLLQNCSDEKNRIILANLHTKIDAVPRYSKQFDTDDIPF